MPIKQCTNFRCKNVCYCWLHSNTINSGRSIRRVRLDKPINISPERNLFSSSRQITVQAYPEEETAVSTSSDKLHNYSVPLFSLYFK